MRKLSLLVAPFVIVAGLSGTALAQGTQQEGLVNINAEGVQIAVPINIAAQVCNVNVGVIPAAPSTVSRVSPAIPFCSNIAARAFVI